MSRTFHGLVFFCFCFAFASSGWTRTEEEIPPPFGLRWGESSQHLETLLNGTKAKIIDRRTNEKYEVWYVEGIVQTGLRRSLFYLQQNQLVQVELQYESPDWDTDKYESFMGSIRQRLDVKYGPGELMVRSKAPKEKVTQTLVGYKWAKSRSSVQLVYFSAENAQQVFRTVSIHYRAF